MQDQTSAPQTPVLRFLQSLCPVPCPRAPVLGHLLPPRQLLSKARGLAAEQCPTKTPGQDGTGQEQVLQRERLGNSWRAEMAGENQDW